MGVAAAGDNNSGEPVGGGLGGGNGRNDDDTNCSLYVAHDGSDSPDCGATRRSACATIQRAVTNAWEGDTVCVEAGPYDCPDDGQGVRINISLSLVAINGIATIDCAGRGRAFSFLRRHGCGGFVLVGFEMKNGRANHGGAVYASGGGACNLSVVDCSFANNSATEDGGGAIFASNTMALLIQGSSFFGNTAVGGNGAGGAMCSLNASSLRIEGSSFAHNNATQGLGGGAVFSSGTGWLRIESSFFSDNIGPVGYNGNGGGAILSLDDLDVCMASCSFVNNTAAPTSPNENGGGAIYVQTSVGTIAIEDSIFDGNTAALGNWTGGGGIYGEALVLRLTGCGFVNNEAKFGGAVFSTHSGLAIVGCTFLGNTATVSAGGAICSFLDLGPFIAHSTFTGNMALQNYGGAIYVENTITGFHVASCNFSGNMAQEASIHMQGITGALVEGCTFVNNSAALDACGRAGALSADSNVNLFVVHCSFIDNHHASMGGAAYFRSSTNVSIVRSTFTGNTAMKDGGAVYTLDVSGMRIEDCTFADNTAQYGGGGAFFSDHAVGLSLYGSTFVGNHASRNFGGAINLYDSSNSHVSGCTFVDNAAADGGAVFSDRTFDLYRIEDCTFVNNTAQYGGAVYSARYVNNRVEGCMFVNNTAGQLGGGYLLIDTNNDSVVVFENNTIKANSAAFGGGVCIWFWNKAYQISHNISHHFIGGAFLDNNATKGNGGAVCVVLSPDAPNNTEPTYPGEIEARSWIYTGNRNRFQGVAFARNGANCSQCTGGALYINGGETDIQDCRFEGNEAGVYGGAIGIGGLSTEAFVRNSSFSNNNKATSGGGHLYSFSGGALNVVRSSFEVRGAAESFIEVPQGGERVSVSRCNIFCSAGSGLVNDTPPPYEADIAPWGVVMVTTTSLRCKPCDVGRYSLDGSILLGEEGPLLLRNISCRQCPGEADCRGGADVFSLPGYWCGPVPQGENNNTVLECLECPQGHCRSDSPSLWNTTCIGNRKGILCGECMHDYGEAFGTHECVRNDGCTIDNSWWFLPASLGLGLVYIIVLAWFPVSHHPLWKSVVYFMQIVPLLVAYGGDGNRVMGALFALFVLDPSVLGIHANACPWPGLTAIQKMAAGYLLPVVLFVELGSLATVHLLSVRLSHRYRNRPLDNSGESTTTTTTVMIGDDDDNDGMLPPNNDGSLQEEREHLIARDDVGNDNENDDIREEDCGDDADGGESAMVVNGDEKDDGGHHQGDANHKHRRPWLSFSVIIHRYAAASMGLVLLTYEGVTSVTMDLLHCVRFGDGLVLFGAGYHGCFAPWQVLLLVFLGSFLGPFPLLLLLLRRAIRWRRGWWLSSPGHAVLMVLEKPYAPNRGWWESANMFRRLALVALATFVPDPLWRAIGLFLGCSGVLLAHLVFRPFADRRHGRVEAFFLCDLTLIAALHIPEAAMRHKGLPFEKDDAASILGYMQTALVLLPLLYCLLALVAAHAPALFGWMISHRHPKQHATSGSRSRRRELFSWVHIAYDSSIPTSKTEEDSTEEETDPERDEEGNDERNAEGEVPAVRVGSRTGGERTEENGADNIQASS